jgi:branched-chain amino acid aminotransferase
MNYLNNILAKIEANRKGVPEAIMLNVRGEVAECTGDNVFFIKGRTIVTPPVSAGVLVGITRAVVMDLVRRKTSYRMREKAFRPAALFAADEVFFTGTAAEVIPVTRIDNRKIGSGRPGPITTELMNLFQSLTRDETTGGRGR